MLVTVKSPCRKPAAVGANETLTVQLFEAARVAPHVVVSVYPDEVPMLAISTVVDPELVIVTICGGLVAFTASFPNASVPTDKFSGELFKLPVATKTLESNM